MIRSFTTKIRLDKNVYRVGSYKNIIISCKINNRKVMTHLVDKIFMRSHTIKFLKYGIFLTLKTIKVRSSSSQNATACNTYVSEQQREMHLILSFESYKIL